MKTEHAELVVDCQAAHGEGPVWDAANRRLLWVDLTGCKLHALDSPTGRHETREFSEPVCAAGPGDDGRLLVAFAKRLAWVDWSTGDTETICEVEPGKPGNRCNDGKLYTTTSRLGLDQDGFVAAPSSGGLFRHALH
jgi:sugar lactone lactonase YvrE